MMIDASARRVQESRLAARDLTLAIATFIWTGLLLSGDRYLSPIRVCDLRGPFSIGRGLAEVVSVNSARRVLRARF